MSGPRPDEAKRLFAAAERDRLSFLLLIETGRAPNETLGFLAQQACEKYLKAILASQGASFGRTHDLDHLARSVLAGGVALPVAIERLAALNPYAVAIRYEGTEVVWVENDEAAQLVAALRDCAQRWVGGAAP
ncbi:MAG: HEPN domain-containing protein [Rhodocyclaceae bacterium]|nr:HEPN domain-containing protein [Rhodocyclaceae bacterium]